MAGIMGYTYYQLLIESHAFLHLQFEGMAIYKVPLIGNKIIEISEKIRAVSFKSIILRYQQCNGFASVKY